MPYGVRLPPLPFPLCLLPPGPLCLMLFCAPKSQRCLRFAIAMPIADPEIARFPRQEKAMLHCGLRVRWTVASDLRFRAAISEPKTPSFCRNSGDLLAPSTPKSLAIAIVRFWCAKAEQPQSVDKHKRLRERLNGHNDMTGRSSGGPDNRN